MRILFFLIISSSLQAQYVVRVQRQVLFDALRARALDVRVASTDSTISALKIENAGMHQTIKDCVILNTDRLGEISLLKQVNFDSNKEIILLNKDNKRLKRQTRLLKILIPVAVAGTIWLSK